MDAYEGDEYLDPEAAIYATSSQGSSSQTSTLTWINWFTSLPGHDYYCDVSEDYIEDDFNLTGLQAQVPFWKEALEMVLDVEPEEDSLTIPDVSIVESSAELLYGLVHSRYILTKPGLAAMHERYEEAGFGICPRVYCYGMAVIPCGKSDTPGLDTVKLYCPNCQDIYAPPSSKYSNVDGAFFGTSFPALFFDTYNWDQPVPFKGVLATMGVFEDPDTPRSEIPQISLDADMPHEHGGKRKCYARVYTPRIYGFKVSERARSGPRMAWLRDRPDNYAGLETVDWRGRWKEEAQGGAAGEGKAAAGQDKVEASSALFEEDEVKSDNEEEDEEEE